MFLTEFQVTSYFLVYVALLLVSAVFVLLKDRWSFKDKLLRLLVLFLIPVLGLLMLAVEQLMKMRGAMLQKKRLAKLYGGTYIIQEGAFGRIAPFFCAYPRLISKWVRSHP
jgi:hypothetical protein